MEQVSRLAALSFQLSTKRPSDGSLYAACTLDRAGGAALINEPGTRTSSGGFTQAAASNRLRTTPETYHEPENRGWRRSACLHRQRAGHKLGGRGTGFGGELALLRLPFELRLRATVRSCAALRILRRLRCILRRLRRSVALPWRSAPVSRAPLSLHLTVSNLDLRFCAHQIQLCLGAEREAQ